MISVDEILRNPTSDEARSATASETNRVLKGITVCAKTFLKSSKYIDGNDIIYAAFFPLGTCHQNVINFLRDKDSRWTYIRGWMIHASVKTIMATYHSLVCFTHMGMTKMIDITLSPCEPYLYFFIDTNLTGSFKKNYEVTHDGELLKEFFFSELSDD